MDVHRGNEEEYEKRHNPIWPELEQVRLERGRHLVALCCVNHASQALKAHGVQNYSIFLHEGTNQLFGYAEIDSEDQWAAIAKTDVCKRWWAHMKDVMPSNPDNSPKVRGRLLRNDRI